MSSVTSISVDR